MTRILAIVPCYNEQGTIRTLAIELSRLPELTVLVIDDCSTDSTRNEAAGLDICHVASLKRNLGIGGAVQTGILYALQEDYDFCVQVDGDGQHPPHEISKLLDRQRETGSNIVIGSRYLESMGFQSTRLRRMGIRLIRFALSVGFTRTLISDPTSGFRLMDRKAIELFARNYPYDFPEPISVAWALRRGLSISEVPVEMRERVCNTSSITGMKTAIYMLRVIGYIVLYMIADWISEGVREKCI